MVKAVPGGFDLTNIVCFLRLQSTAGIPNHVLSSRGYFFDNPRRYDSDDDLAWSIPPQNATARYRHAYLVTVYLFIYAGAAIIHVFHASLLLHIFCTWSLL